MGEPEEQEAVHRALEELIPDLPDDSILTGWLVIYEYQVPGDRPSCGHVYGPAGMTTWRAMGLAHWAQTVTLRPDAGEE